MIIHAEGRFAWRRNIAILLRRHYRAKGRLWIPKGIYKSGFSITKVEIS